ncbi:MAG: type II toxin-antitoxin system VapC family toxin [Hyphomicrobium sp.]
MIDASVALKWYLGHLSEEKDVIKAATLGDLIWSGAVELIAPSHFVAEVIAVLAREKPEHVDDALVDLDAMRPELIASHRVLRRAADLSITLNHHLFDTLYHAVALECDATLVTADSRYFAKASGQGCIQTLSLFQGP